MIPYIFSYDIPDEADIANPSGELRKIGFRLNKSVWIVLEEDIPYALIHSLTEAGSICHTFRFDVREAEPLRQLAARELGRELSASLATARRKASQASIDYMEGGDTPQELARTHRTECRRLIRVYRETIDSISEAARKFNVHEHIRIGEAENAFRAMRQTLAATARNYMLDMLKIEKVFGKDALPVQAARSGRPMPPGILRDWITDEGL